MGQTEVIRFLEKRENYRQWLHRLQITDGLDVSANSVNVALKQLIKYDLVEYKVVKGEFKKRVKLYRCKPNKELEIKYKIEEII